MANTYTAVTKQDGVRGKYFEAYQRGANLIFPGPDVAKIFSTEKAAPVGSSLDLMKP